MDSLRLVALDRRRLQDFEHLLSGREFNGCYCARWTTPSELWQERCRTRPHENLEHSSGRVRAGQSLGYLVVRESDGAVVAWTGAGPKTSFSLLKTEPGSRKGEWSADIWCVACLAVGRSFRSLGYAAEVVRLLVEAAREAGARSIEAYPIEPGSGDCAYRGERALYERLGFSVADTDREDSRTALRMEKALSGG